MPIITSIHDGKQITVKQLTGDPKVIPTRVIDRLENAFIAESILYNGGTATTPAVTYERNAQSYVAEDPEAVAEYAEIPLASPRTGEIITQQAAKFGSGVVASQEMIDFNDRRRLDKSITQVVNTFRRWNDRQLWDAFNAAGVPTMPVSVAWNQQGADPRYDFSMGMSSIGEQKALVNGDISGAFTADTIVMHTSVAPLLVGSEKWNNVYASNLANESIRYTGKLPNDIMGLAVLTTPYIDPKKVLLLERGTAGFFSDPRPLGATTLYPMGGGGNGGPTETWRSDVTQMRNIGIDEPNAALWLTGVTA